MLLAIGIASSPSCSLTADAGRFEDGVCGADTKACNGKCVPLNDPKYGCASVGCEPCNLPNASATVCDANGSCQIAGCATGYDDCNRLANDGCEVDLAHDPDNCGHCGCECGSGDPSACTTPQVVGAISHGRAGCSARLCTVGSCEPGWGDCDAQPSNGCETPTNTNQNCGACGDVCDSSCACVCRRDDATDCACVSPDGGLCPSSVSGT